MADRTAERLTDQQLHAIYDQQYVDIYDPHAIPRLRRLLPFFDLTPDASVADFACGNGVLLELIAARVREYVGVDFSEPFVRAAERRREARGLANARFECSDIVRFCEKRPNEFDAGFALDFSEHIYDDQFVQIFGAIRRALKPGAPLYVHTPNAEYFLERLHASGILKQVEGHVAVRDAASYRRLLGQSGFTKVDVRYLPHYLRLASRLHFLSGLPSIGRHFRARLLLTCRV
jgi:cyclopropane fatty-acyl-phospholipid synthase-like methyltransferase